MRMNEEDFEHDSQEPRVRRIVLKDGRYMIFYTFGDEPDEVQPGNDHGENV